MFGELRASLYDLFGYLFPGAVLFAALCLVLGLLAPADVVFGIDAFGKAPIAVVVLGTSYVLGHLAHAAGNAIPVLRTDPAELLLADPSLPAEILTLATARVAKISGAHVTELSNAEVLALLDEYVKMHGNAAEREIFVYREGFYRGMTIASAVLGIVVGLQAAAGPVCVVDGTSGRLCSSWPQLATISLLAFIAAYGFFRRMRRFGRYKVKTALYGFVMLPKKPADGKPAV